MTQMNVTVDIIQSGMEHFSWAGSFGCFKGRWSRGVKARQSGSLFLSVQRSFL
jgi:hypothetical protein